MVMVVVVVEDEAPVVVVGPRNSNSSNGDNVNYSIINNNTSTMLRRAFSFVVPSIWNSLPSQIRLLPKIELHAFALQAAYN